MVKIFKNLLLQNQISPGPNLCTKYGGQDLFTARSNLLPHAFVWAIYIYIGNIEVTCRSTVAKIVLIGNLRWSPFCLCLLYFPATVLFTCIKSWLFRNYLANVHQISHWSYCWNVIDSLFKWSRSIDCQAHIFFFKLRTIQMMIFSLVAMIGLEKCYIIFCLSAVATSLWWVSHGPWASCLQSNDFVKFLCLSQFLSNYWSYSQW